MNYDEELKKMESDRRVEEKWFFGGIAGMFLIVFAGLAFLATR